MTNSIIERLKKLFPRKKLFNSPHNYKSAVLEIKNQIIDQSKQLTLHCSSRFNIPQHKLESYISEIRLHERADINGYAIYSDDSQTFDIEIGIRLIGFLFKSVTLFVVRAKFLDEATNQREDPSHTIDEMTPVAKELMEAFWNGTLDGVLGFTMENMSRNRRIVRNSLIAGAERFVMGHELGHVVMKFHPEISELSTGIFLAENLLRLAN